MPSGEYMATWTFPSALEADTIAIDFAETIADAAGQQLVDNRRFGLTIVPGDVNLDLQVDALDQDIVDPNVGSSLGDPTYATLQDIVGDGEVDVVDLGLIVANLGTSVPAGPPPEAPIAEDDSATTDEDTAIDIDVLFNDTDANLDTLTVSSIQQPADGTVANFGNWAGIAVPSSVVDQLIAEDGC